MIHFYTANLTHTTNLTLRAVGAGHARPAGFPLHPFHLNPVGEGFIPPAYPTPSPTQRATRRGGIHAARAPCLYHQPHSPPPCRGRACPACNLSDTTTCGHRTTNPQHAPCPKITLKICRKNQKQPLTTVIHIAIIIKLSRGSAPRRQPLKPIPTACTRFLKKTSSKNFQKTS